MRKLILYLLILSVSITYSQVTTSPTFPTETDVITISFDATGTNLENYVGDVFAHTGVISNLSANDSDWKHVIGSWGNNVTQPKLTSTGTNTYQLTISPNLLSYYSISAGETVSKLAFVFRNAAGNQQSSNYFVQIYSEDFTIAVQSPLNQSVYNLNDVININAESNISADLELRVNNSSVQTVTNSTTITSSYTFSSTGNHTISAFATQNTETVEDHISVYVKTTTLNEALPTGVTNGVNYNTDGSVTFVLEAPNKSDVFVIGTFNNWEIDAAYQMKKDGDLFWLTVTGLDPDTEYAFQYLIDYDIKIADPYSTKILDPNNDQDIPDSTFPNLMSYPSGATGIVSAFKINETSYTWQNTSFSKPLKNDLVIYEMLIRDFTQNRNFKEATTHLDYLKNLGINAIELMPVNEFENNISWGYNPSFYMALDKAYGTQNDFKEFVDQCHARGIAVLVDVVFNHSFSQSPLLQMYWDGNNERPAADNPYYNENHNFVDNTNAHWGYDFNHESTYTVNFFNNVLSYWMNEYKIDGFRFDFTKGFSNTLYYGADNWGSDYDAARIENLKAYADHIWSQDASAYVIFEHLSYNPEETELANYGIMLWGNLNPNYNQNTMGYSSDSNISSISYKERGWNNAELVGYMESHDEERLMVKNLAYGNENTTYSVKDLNTALNRQKTAAAVFYGIPGPKMLWQFGELGYDKSINCEADITDGSCRTDIKASAWELGYDTNSSRLELYDVTARMINLKIHEPVFEGDFVIEDSYNSNNLLKRIYVWNDALLTSQLKNVIIIANFDIVAQNINPNFPYTGTWYDLMDNTTTIDGATTSITLQPGEFKIYGNQSSALSVSNNKMLNFRLYPNPTSTSFKLNKNIKKLEIFDVTGKLIKQYNNYTTAGTNFDISNLSKNIYLIKIMDESGNIGVSKLVKW